MQRKWVAVLGSLAATVAGVTAGLWACGPFLEDLPTVVRIHPAEPERYAGGELGVVRPSYTRLDLLHAYRVLAGKSPLADAPAEEQNDEPTWPPSYFGLSSRWAQASAEVLGEEVAFIGSQRSVPGGDYQFFASCLADGFASALRTLEDRRARFGEQSEALRDWTRAQRAVFANCGDGEPVLPAAAPASAPALLRADRAYQTAAAYFYALRYDEAGTSFAAIARDTSSPWRPYGRYLAGRNLIRQATLTADGVAGRDALFAGAEEELRATLGDPGAKGLHASAHGLLDLVASRRRPVDRLHQLSAKLLTAAAPAARERREYEWLMDRFVGGNTVDYEYDAVTDRAAIVEGDDASDWVLALQGHGDAALARAVDRWQATRSVPWLIAVLWKAPADHPAVPAALEAAAAVNATSAAHPTVAFLRVRLLSLAGRRAEARTLLASMPTATGPGIAAETLNLVRAQRFLLADGFDELLASATRTALDGQSTPVFDDDAGSLFTGHTPLARLVEAAAAPVLPPRLRLRIASAALARAIFLGRAAEGARAAGILKELASPAVHADLDRYAAAVHSIGGKSSEDERRRAGLLLMLRTPGLHAYVLGMEDDAWTGEENPSRELDHTWRRNWWCVTEGRLGPAWSEESSTLASMLGGSTAAPVGALSAEELAAASGEVAELVALGGARDRLAALVLDWARARPTDPELAEALARVVEAGRWAGCAHGDERSAALSRQAFQTLHRLFPKSEWARQTKYWYD